MPRPFTRVVAAAAGLLTAGSVFVAVAPASGAAAVPATPRGLTTAIEPMGGYVEQTSCDTRTRPGTKKLAQLLARTYPAGRSYNTTYTCGTDGTRSEHYDGRAIDWMVSLRNTKQRSAAESMLKWLLATDSHGNQFAMARRLGVMYLIWNNRIWGGWSGRWEPYNNCAKFKSRSDDNWCHRTHVHISLTWNGAMGRTTYWTNKVSATDYGPCRYTGMNWAPRYARANYNGCANVPKASAGKRPSAAKKALVSWSGIVLRKGSRGPAVSAVQRALHVSATGVYSASTAGTVARFQRAKHLQVTGTMYTPTWRALLAATR